MKNPLITAVEFDIHSYLNLTVKTTTCQPFISIVKHGGSKQAFKLWQNDQNCPWGDSSCQTRFHCCAIEH